MTNDEKAEEICRDYNYTQFLNDGTHDTYTESAILYMLHEMAEWKEQQLIDKAVKWLENNYSNYEQTYADVGGYISSDFDIDKMLTDLRNVMK